MKIKRTFHYYWISAKKYKWLFYATFLTYGIAVILSATINPLIFKSVIDTISSTDVPSLVAEKVLNLVLLLALNVFVYNLFYRAGDYLLVAFETRSMRDISRETFSRLARHSYNFYANSFAGALVAKAKRFTSSFQSLADKISVDLYFIILRITGVLVILFIKVPVVAYAFLIWLTIYVYITYLFLKKKQIYDKAAAEMDSIVTGSIADVITNILNLKIFSSAKRERDRHFGILSKEYKAMSKAENFNNLQLTAQGFLIGALQAGTLYAMVVLWIQGEVSTGMVVLVQTYVIMLFESLWNIGRVMMRLTKDLSNAKEIVDIFDKKIDILDPEKPEILKINAGKIQFDKVSFEYVEDSLIFNEFSLNVKSGEKVGLVGYSGSGKSTITKMLLRFIDIKKGSICIDNQDISKITQDDLRSVISYVPQDPILFHRSIKENIAYSKNNANDEEVIEAAKKAHAHEFISSLQYGYDTLVGERGVKLSGGERQRVAIARAMLKDAPILILDEATSSLDSVSESYIQEAFIELMKGKTTIVIAHRLSTIQKMDRIIVLNKGKITEEGTHKELLEKGGTYAELWNRQTGGFLE